MIEGAVFLFYLSLVLSGSFGLELIGDLYLDLPLFICHVLVSVF